jgi:hypothetical protein
MLDLFDEDSTGWGQLEGGILRSIWREYTSSAFLKTKNTKCSCKDNLNSCTGDQFGTLGAL